MILFGRFVSMIGLGLTLVPRFFASLVFAELSVVEIVHVYSGSVVLYLLDALTGLGVGQQTSLNAACVAGSPRDRRLL